MRQRRVVTALAIPLVLAFVAASCGSDSDSSSEVTTGDATEETTAPDEGETEETTAPDEGETEETTAPDEGEEAAETTVAESAEPAEPGVYGGTVSIGLEAEANGLRPWEDGCASGCVNMARTIYDPLMAQTAEGNYEGYLAESIEANEDFTVWTLTLRPGITFSNGVPLTAQSIADMFAIQQGGAISSGTIATISLNSVEATDDLTVVYTLESGNSAFPSNLAGVSLGYVFEPAAAAADPDNFGFAPVGTGPFTLDKRDIDNETVVVRSDNYWRTAENGDQLPYLDSVVFRPIPDEGTRLDAAVSGTTNAMMTLRGATVRDARETDLTMYEFLGSDTGGGMFNTAEVPLDDIRVRQGLNKMNDQERVIVALGNDGISERTTQWFSSSSPWWTQEAADTYPDFDFPGGQALLQEYIDDPNRSDGKAVGEKIDVELSCPPDPTLLAAMQVIEQVWSGSEQVNVNLTQFDQATHIQNALNDEHKAHCWRWSGEGDPSASLNPFLADPEVSVGNLPNNRDDETFALAVAAIETDDIDERKELYSQINQRINEQAIIWYSGGTATAIAVDPAIRNVDNWTLPSGSPGVGTPSAVTFYTEMYLSDQ